MLIYVKILLIIRFLYCLWKYRNGSSTGVNFKNLILDFLFLISAVYLLSNENSFTTESIYVDSLLVLISVIYLIEVILIIRLYSLSKDFGLYPEKRLIFFVEYYFKKNKKNKSYRMLLSHFDIVKKSSPLLIYLGDYYHAQNKFEEAYSCFVEAAEYTNDENLLIGATTKAFHVCAKDLKDFDSAKIFVESQIFRDISQQHISALEKLIK